LVSGLCRVWPDLDRVWSGSYWVEIGFYERFLGVYGEQNRPKPGSFGDFGTKIVQFFLESDHFGAKPESWSRESPLLLRWKRGWSSKNVFLSRRKWSFLGSVEAKR
jgi:hypothetical protein